MQLQLTKTGVITLADFKAKVVIEIDAAAGAARSRYITTVAGQSETYQMKLAECTAYKAAGYPADLTLYPWVASEAEAQDLTPTAAADLVLSTTAQWVTAGALIEKNRLKGKRRAKAALTFATVLTETKTAIDIINAI